MNQRVAPRTGKLSAQVDEVMAALDMLEERLDRIADRLNLLWDQAVAGETREEVKEPTKTV